MAQAVRRWWPRLPPSPTHTSEGWCRLDLAPSADQFAPLSLSLSLSAGFPSRGACGGSRRPDLVHTERANGAMAVGTRQNGKRAKAADTHEDWDNGRCHRSQPIFLLGQPPIDPEQIEKVHDEASNKVPLSDMFFFHVMLRDSTNVF
ncbi:uncharacterized protein LOC110436130 [Sorghum bicolor]|uniref:uncharacterized protein LOC110436130 n=1 Tax=Sorghum bicolor TaxID=4558 RepID=UPI000B426767|nr:uncharacterized protein LOC110436130 [Sorghum bicolor]|eukprot:XP_021318051.1 uncharacterized protein LOC110436130 [Sorghum bicolor]